MMEILEIKQANDALAEMVALFCVVELRSYKGIASRPNIKAGREEMEEYLFAKFPGVCLPWWMTNTQAMWFVVSS